ncbi:Carbohydrate-binding WSC subgroup [Penicillium riverlandense]|uniref:Carbohydrate-binding WSC subgroup n=1 Tax=Penicillium riverlandense TaxID=1903569 RepID=UPI002546B5B6|nr:Carbohydrate-binding WSC subgroup [Penicillium riverlandense]KAJ5833768.1 Carbohydrate-binding WSC subgroup [Penicillium riverlandense]
MHLSLSVSLAILLARPFVSAASDLAYCSSDNTGSSFSAVSDNFQSNGACETTCKNYAFGVLQGKKCWCSNVAPSSSSTSKTSDCDTSCPGYPNDSCGSAAQGVYAYVAISGNSPTSTAGGSSSTSSSSTTTSDRVVQTTSSNGQVVTITEVAPTPTASSSSSNSSGGSSLSGGAIAGIVIGVLGGLALIAGLVILVFFYRRRSRAESPAPSQDMTDNRTSRGSSFMPSAQSGNGRPNQFTDNRLRTDAVVYSHGRQDSSTSLQDNEDYSRPVLRLTNPD